MQSQWRFDKINNGYNIRQVYIHNFDGSPTDDGGWRPFRSPQFYGTNWLSNPSFANLDTGWVWTNAPDTIQNLQSEISNGEMLRVKWNEVQALAYLRQTFPITDNMVGMELTFSAYTKYVGDNSFVSVSASGTGINSDESVSRAYLANVWFVITATITPLTAGDLSIGFWFANATEAYVDEAYFTKTLR